MSAPNITLPYPFILLTPSNSGLGIGFIGNSPMKFGTVAAVYSTSDRVAVAQSVIYDSRQGQQFIYGSSIYIMISDEFVTGQEVLPP